MVQSRLVEVPYLNCIFHKCKKYHRRNQSRVIINRIIPPYLRMAIKPYQLQVDIVLYVGNLFRQCHILIVDSRIGILEYLGKLYKRIFRLL